MKLTKHFLQWVAELCARVPQLGHFLRLSRTKENGSQPSGPKKAPRSAASWARPRRRPMKNPMRPLIGQERIYPNEINVQMWSRAAGVMDGFYQSVAVAASRLGL